MNVINVAISDMISQNGDQFFGRVPILSVIFLQIIQQFYSWKTQHLIKILQKIPYANVKLSQVLGSDSCNRFFFQLCDSLMEHSELIQRSRQFLKMNISTPQLHLLSDGAPQLLARPLREQHCLMENEHRRGQYKGLWGHYAKRSVKTSGKELLEEVTFHLRSKAMATHSSTLAWKIPWMEEPGRLQCIGS